MISKIKMWILGSVIMKKVIGKFAKHMVGAVLGILASPHVAPYLDKLGITVDSISMEAGLTIILIGFMGAAWNFIEHRFFKK